jgi:hypothetical protein
VKIEDCVARNDYIKNKNILYKNRFSYNKALGSGGAVFL